jgi:hypothetical protein
MKTYKFLALLDVQCGELDSTLVAKLNKNYNRPWQISGIWKIGSSVPY